MSPGTLLFSTPQDRRRATPARVVFVNRFFAPDLSATSQMLTQLSQRLAHDGWDVAVVTGRSLYGRPGRLPPRERIGGAAVERVASTRLACAFGLAGRAMDAACFHVVCLVALLRRLRRGDVVVAMTDPPLLSVTVMIAALLRRAVLVNWLHDLYPEIAAAAGVRWARGVSGALLTRLRDASLRAAAVNVPVSGDMAARLAPHAQPARVQAIHNWCDDLAVRPVVPRDNPLRRSWGLEGRLVLGYAGNLGRSHDWRTLLAAVEVLRERRDVIFLLVGGGAGSDLLRAEVGRRDLQSLFRFERLQPTDQLAWSLGAADLHLISRRAAFRDLVFPCKVFAAAAAGRGMIVLDDPASELCELVQAHACGEVCPVGDGAGLAEVIVRLIQQPDRVAMMGVRARAMLDAHYRRDQAFDRWGAVLRQAVGSAVAADLSETRTGSGDFALSRWSSAGLIEHGARPCAD